MRALASRGRNPSTDTGSGCTRLASFSHTRPTVHFRTRRTPLFTSQGPPGPPCVRFTWNARLHRHRTALFVRRQCSVQLPDGQNTGRPVSHREWRNAARRMIPVTDEYPRHCDAPVGPGSWAFDALTVLTHIHRCQIRRRAALARIKTNARNGSGVPCPL